MILQFMEMDKLNAFFRIVFSNPMLIWKAGAGLVFMGFGLAMFFMPGLSGLGDGTTKLFAGLLFLYGAYRMVTFYVDYKSIRDGK
ncbi:MAG: hypothetical protein U0V74_16385 [Chitinophagales bacterium]